MMSAALSSATVNRGPAVYKADKLGLCVVLKNVCYVADVGFFSLAKQLKTSRSRPAAAATVLQEFACTILTVIRNLWTAAVVVIVALLPISGFVLNIQVPQKCFKIWQWSAIQVLRFKSSTLTSMTSITTYKKVTNIDIHMPPKLRVCDQRNILAKRFKNMPYSTQRGKDKCASNQKLGQNLGWIWQVFESLEHFVNHKLWTWEECGCRCLLLF